MTHLSRLAQEEGRQVAKLRFKIAMSLDGYSAGPQQSKKNPLGVGGMRLHEWAFPLAAWRAMHGLEGGEVNQSTPVVDESLANLGATIMGRNMFGGHPGPWDARKPWNGWWGNNPPFHHPVFVLTHHPRPPLLLEGGNTPSSPMASRRRWSRRGVRRGARICRLRAGQTSHSST
jgi:dihydrofolate reductase